MTASFSSPADFEWPSPIDRALNAGYDPAPGDADQPVMNDAELEAYFARIIRCSHPHCRTSLTDDDMTRCPHDLPFCEMCVWEDGCDECANGAPNYYGTAS